MSSRARAAWLLAPWLCGCAPHSTARHSIDPAHGDASSPQSDASSEEFDAAPSGQTDATFAASDAELPTHDAALDAGTVPPDEWPELSALLAQVRGVADAPIPKVVTDKYTPGMLLGNGDLGVVVGGADAHSQQFFFGKSDFWGTSWKDGTTFQGSILSLGSLTIRSQQTSTGSGYHMEQDVANAEVTSTLSLGAANVTMRAFTADSDDVLIVELSSSADSEAVTLELSLALPAADGHAVYPASFGRDASTLWFTRENNLTGKTDYKARAALALRALGAELTNTRSDDVGASAELELSPGASVRVAALLRSHAGIGQGGPTREALADDAVSASAALTDGDLARFSEEHHAFWKDYWQSSWVELNDAVLRDYYYGALYVMGSVSREGSRVPPGIWASFVTGDRMAWGGRFFMNYNFQAPYYGLGSSNRLAAMAPFLALQFVEAAFQQQKTADKGYDGVCYQRTFTPSELFRTPPTERAVAATEKPTELQDQKSNASFGAMLAIDYWEYSQDQTYLKERLYPHLRMLDAFWRDFMTWDGQRYVIDHSSAHEGSDDLNPNLDLGFMRRVLTTLLTTSDVLGVDTDLHATWQDTLDKLAEDPIGKYQDKDVYLIAEVVKGSRDIAETFEPGNQPINLEGTVFPGGNLALGGDAQKLARARDTLAAMDSWGVTKGGNSNNGLCKEFPIAARIGWPADDLFAKLRAAIQKHWRATNLTMMQGGGGIETAGTIEAVNSMLLQSENGVLKLFPVWPNGQPASFRRLRAKGAFLVSSSWAEGKVESAEIYSERGGPLRVQNPFAGKDVRVQEANGTQVKYEQEGDVMVLQTQAGTTYQLSAD